MSNTRERMQISRTRVSQKKVMFAAPLFNFNCIVDDSLKAVKLKIFSNKF